MSRSADLRPPMRTVLLLAALAVAVGCVRPGAAQEPSVSELIAVYDADVAAVRAAVLEALHGRGHTTVAPAEGADEGRLLVDVAPEARLALAFRSAGARTRLDAVLVYYGPTPDLLHYNLHYRVAEALSADGVWRGMLLPIATHPEGSPPCTTPDSVFRARERVTLVEEDERPPVDEQPPELIGGLRSIRPDYPADAMMRGIEGRVMTSFNVEADGSVSCVEAVVGPRELAPAALAAVADARFRPARRHGEPVRIRFSLPINFRLAD